MQTTQMVKYYFANITVLLFLMPLFSCGGQSEISQDTSSVIDFETQRLNESLPAEQVLSLPDFLTGNLTNSVNYTNQLTDWLTIVIDASAGNVSLRPLTTNLPENEYTALVAISGSGKNEQSYQILVNYSVHAADTPTTETPTNNNDVASCDNLPGKTFMPEIVQGAGIRLVEFETGATTYSLLQGDSSIQGTYTCSEDNFSLLDHTNANIAYSGSIDDRADLIRLQAVSTPFLRTKSNCEWVAGNTYNSINLANNQCSNTGSSCYGLSFKKPMGDLVIDLVSKVVQAKYICDGIGRISIFQTNDTKNLNIQSINYSVWPDRININLKEDNTVSLYRLSNQAQMDSCQFVENNTFATEHATGSGCGVLPCKFYSTLSFLNDNRFEHYHTGTVYSGIYQCSGEKLELRNSDGSQYIADNSTVIIDQQLTRILLPNDAESSDAYFLMRK